MIFFVLQTPTGYSSKFLAAVCCPVLQTLTLFQTIKHENMSFPIPILRPGTRFSKAPITNGPVKLLLFTCKIEV